MNRSSKLSPRILVASLPYFLSLLTGQLGLKVRWEAGVRTAYTNLKEVVFEPIYLHQFADDKKLMQLYQLYFGKAWHEGGHHLYTDMIYSAKWREDNPKIASFYMPLEDARMEAEIVKAFPGARQDLNSAFDTLTEIGVMGPTGDDAKPRAMLQNYLLCRGRAITRHQSSCLQWADDMHLMMVNTFGLEFKTRLDDLLATRLPALKDTAGTCALVEEIRIELENELESEEESSKQSSQSAEPDDASEQQHQAQQQQKQAIDNAINGDDEGICDIDAALDKAFAEVAKENALNQLADPQYMQRIDDVTMNEAKRYFDSPRAKYVYAKFDKADLETRQLAASIRVKLEATKRQSMLPCKRGRFNPTALIRIPCHDDRMFLQETYRKEVNTAVFVLLDTSSSMNHDRRISQAREATYCTAKAMNSLRGVTVAVGTFPCATLIKRWSSNAINELSFGVEANESSTPLAMAIAAAKWQLSLRKEPRKLLIVMTDGVPNSKPDAILQRELAEAEGIEVYGIGIQHDAISQIFPRNAVINNLQELTPHLMNLIGGRLLNIAA